jgi:hypothetical protein
MGDNGFGFSGRVVMYDANMRRASAEFPAWEAASPSE